MHKEKRVTTEENELQRQGILKPLNGNKNQKYLRILPVNLIKQNETEGKRRFWKLHSTT